MPLCAAAITCGRTLRQGELILKEPASGPVLYRSRYLLPICSPPIEDGALLVENGLVRAVGTYRELTAVHAAAAPVDFGDAVLLPPMVNAHTHLELSNFTRWAVAAGRPDPPRDFVDWILWLVSVRRTVDEAQLREALCAGLQASLAAGTGAVGDILTSLEASPAYLDSPLRGTVYAEVLGRDAASVERRLATIGEVTRRAPAAALAWGLAPHAPYTLSSETLDQAFAFASRHALPCSIHLAESAAESRFMHDGSGAIATGLYAAARWDPAAEPAAGCTPVQALCRASRLRPGDLAVHGVQVAAGDIEQLRRQGCPVVLCPRSNAALEVGRAPVADYRRAGIPLALGTDSLASAASLSVWDELAFAHGWFAGQAEPRDWLEIATLGGARALGLHRRMGQLAPGCEASFQVVELPVLPALPALEQALCSAGDRLKVTHLFLSARNVLPDR